MAVQGAVNVGVVKQGLDREQHGGCGVDGAPIFLQGVEADGAVSVDVGVVARGDEGDNRGIEGIVLRELQEELELKAFVDSLIGTLYGGDPLEQIIVVREGTDALDVGHHQLHELLLESLRGLAIVGSHRVVEAVGLFGGLCCFERTGANEGREKERIMSSHENEDRKTERAIFSCLSDEFNTTDETTQSSKGRTQQLRCTTFLGTSTNIYDSSKCVRMKAILIAAATFICVGRLERQANFFACQPSEPSAETLQT